MTTTTATVTVGIPAGVDPENVRSRKAAMVAAGTPDIYAEAIAITAAHQQYLRDNKIKETPTVVDKPVTAPVVVKKIEKVKHLSKSNAPKKTAIPTAVADPTAAPGA